MDENKPIRSFEALSLLWRSSMLRYRLTRVAACVLILLAVAFLLYLAIPAFLADCYYRQGVAYDKARDWHRAIEAYQRAIAIEPTNALYRQKLADVYATLARIYPYKDYYAAAVREYQRGISLNPHDGFLYSYLGWAHLYQEEFEAAVRAFEEAIERDPNNAYFHFSLATALKRQGKLEAAKREYEHVLAIFPGHKQARELLQKLNSQANSNK